MLRYFLLMHIHEKLMNSNLSRICCCRSQKQAQNPTYMILLTTQLNLHMYTSYIYSKYLVLSCHTVRYCNLTRLIIIIHPLNIYNVVCTTYTYAVRAQNKILFFKNFVVLSFEVEFTRTFQIREYKLLKIKPKEE